MTILDVQIKLEQRDRKNYLVADIPLYRDHTYQPAEAADEAALIGVRWRNRARGTSETKKRRKTLRILIAMLAQSDGLPDDADVSGI